MEILKEGVLTYLLGPGLEPTTCELQVRCLTSSTTAPHKMYQNCLFVGPAGEFTAFPRPSAGFRGLFVTNSEMEDKRGR